MKAQKVITISFGMVKAFLIKGDKYILVDTGLPGNFEKIKEQLYANKVDPNDISLIVCTHNHTDHVGELYNLRDFSGAKVAIHKSEAESLSIGKTSETKPTGLTGIVISKFFKNPSFKAVKADILVEDELELDKFGVQGKLLHTPGHTPGSLTVVLNNGEIIAGDLFSGKKTGAKYKANLPIFATDIKELIKSLKKIVELAPMRIYNSHGIPTDVTAVEKLISRLEA